MYTLWFSCFYILHSQLYSLFLPCHRGLSSAILKIRESPLAAGTLVMSLALTPRTLQHCWPLSRTSYQKSVKMPQSLNVMKKLRKTALGFLQKVEGLVCFIKQQEISLDPWIPMQRKDSLCSYLMILFLGLQQKKKWNIRLIPEESSSLRTSKQYYHLLES